MQPIEKLRVMVASILLSIVVLGISIGAVFVSEAEGYPYLAAVF